MNFVCFKGVIKVGNSLINTCSPFASGIVEQIPVDLYNEVIPFAVSSVLLSIRECGAIFTALSKWNKKSAPRIGVFTLAYVTIHGKHLCKPKSSVSEIFPYVSIFNPFAACSIYEDTL